MPSRTLKWGNSLKAYFRQHIEQRRINPNRTDRDYILKIRDKFFPGCPDKTFIANFNSSVAEWRNGFYVNEYNKSKNKCESCFSSFILFMNKTHSSSASETPAAEDDEYNSEEDDDYVGIRRCQHWSAMLERWLLSTTKTANRTKIIVRRPTKQSNRPSPLLAILPQLLDMRLKMLPQSRVIRP